MKNTIMLMSEKDFELIEKQIRKNENIFYAEIDGKEICNLSEYFACVSISFRFPHPAHIWAVYDDWMTDLTWIDKECIVFAIHYYGEFMKDDISNKREIVEDFEELIFPWWEGEVMQHMVGAKPKRFIVYLLD